MADISRKNSFFAPGLRISHFQTCEKDQARIDGLGSHPAPYVHAPNNKVNNRYDRT